MAVTALALDNEIFLSTKRYDFVEFQYDFDSVAAHALGTDEVSGTVYWWRSSEKRLSPKFLRNPLLPWRKRPHHIVVYRNPPIYGASRERVVSRFIKGTLAVDDLRRFTKNLLMVFFSFSGYFKAQRLIKRKNYQDAELPCLKHLTRWRK